MSNDFVAYLNSLHNISAGGSNALAESQALSQYFGEIYEPFSLTGQIINALSDSRPRIIILTGHAGDGKSTIALDIFKQLKQMSLESPLDVPLEEKETFVHGGQEITIIKDMSELSAITRQEYLLEALQSSGSCLIISNTGPLLQSLKILSNNREDLESKILRLLDKPINEQNLEENVLSEFEKEVLIINLTRVDNVSIGANILNKLINHSAWNNCTSCPAKENCPIKLNRDALLETNGVAEERVKWIYQKLTAYEQRLTLRQIVAQLSYSLTGGIGCEKAMDMASNSADQGETCLGSIVFSEIFFGFSNASALRASEELHAINLIKRSTYGLPTNANLDKSLVSGSTQEEWCRLPSKLHSLDKHWRNLAIEGAGVQWRFALRRMAYIFGKEKEGREEQADLFIDHFLGSPLLRDYDQWQSEGKIIGSRSALNHFKESCLRVLVEFFSGFTFGQFDSRDQTLYFTLLRPDQAVVQPTQLIIYDVPFRDFHIDFDVVKKIPLLKLRNSSAELQLTLPLIDYIKKRDNGELGNSLAPIHQAQLDVFRAQILENKCNEYSDGDDIELLQAGIDGSVHRHKYVLDQEKYILERG